MKYNNVYILYPIITPKTPKTTMSISAKIDQLDQDERVLWENMNLVVRILSDTSRNDGYTAEEIIYMIYAIGNLHSHRHLLKDRKFSGCFLFLSRDMPALIHSLLHYITHECVHDQNDNKKRVTRSMAAFHMKTVENYRQVADDLLQKVTDISDTIKRRSERIADKSMH